MQLCPDRSKLCFLDYCKVKDRHAVSGLVIDILFPNRDAFAVDAERTFGFEGVNHGNFGQLRRHRL
jgi:hypothetical protein